MNLDWKEYLAGALVAGFDLHARDTSAPRWKSSQPIYAAALEELTDIAAAAGSSRLCEVLESVAGNPMLGEKHFRSLVSAIGEVAEAPVLSPRLRCLAHHIATNVRLAYFSTGQLSSYLLAQAHTSSELQSRTIHVVIPFRARELGSLRTRNLEACLVGLEAQRSTCPGMRVTVVESDDRPRHAQVLASRVEKYIFQHIAGTFNKSAAVNLGVHDHDDDAGLLCLLDADIVLPPGFLANVTREMVDDAALLPYEEAFCLDGLSSERLARSGASENSLAGHIWSGYLLPRPPGGCLILTQERFEAIGGMDVRFEGWGGEDRDFINRLHGVGEVLRLPGFLLHLMHERPLMRDDHDGIMRDALAKEGV